MLQFAIQIGSAITGLVAAILWFLSAKSAAPAMTYEGLDRLKPFLDQAGRYNRWAAFFTAISMLLSAAVSLFSVAAGC
jgi:formate hydrogenlyase subunit 3/multisubunit Na+/H+ antiporter MnhD subunit